MLEVIKMERKGYGYEIDNPVKAMGAVDSYGYMNSLSAKEGMIVRWVRAHSIYSDKFERMIDEYYVFVLKIDEETIEMRRFSIFIDMYHRYTDKQKPEDFE